MQNNSEKDKDLSSLLEGIKLELLGYVNNKARLFKLEAYQKVSKLTSMLGYSLIVCLIIAISFFFILLGLAFFFGELLNSQAAGFGIMALVSLLSLVIVFLFRRKIKYAILLCTIKTIRKVEANEEEE